MKRLAAILGTMLALTGPAFPQSTPFVGQIMTFAGNFCPTGWLQTNGQLLPIQTYIPLFALLGTTYGGDGRTNFALPKMQPIYTQTRAVLTTCIAIEGVFPAQG